MKSGNFSKGYKPKFFQKNKSLLCSEDIDNYHLSKDEADEFLKCSNDFYYFFENYCQIITIDEGFVKFKPRNYQKRVLQKLEKNNRVILMMGRQFGKSVTFAMYMLHKIIFNKEYSIAITSNKLSSAQGTLKKIQLAYEKLPYFLQVGVESWNQTSLEFSSSSSARAFPTNASGLRSHTFNILFIDEFAIVPEHLAEEFISSTYPVISSGKTAKIFIASTPNGYNHFYDFWDKAKKKQNDYIPIDVFWKEAVLERKDNPEEFRENKIREFGGGKKGEKSFNQEYSCSFAGSTFTLVDSKVISQLTHINPIKTVEGFRIFKIPKEKHIYSIGFDIAENIGQENTAIQVLDVTETPFEQVASFYDNEENYMNIPPKLKIIGDYFNEAYIIGENNGLGQAVLDMLYDQEKYKNVLTELDFTRMGVDEYLKKYKKIRKGIRNIQKTRAECLNLVKEFIETRNVIINDINTVSEFPHFIYKESKNRYEHEPGFNDDAIFALGWSLYYIRSKYWSKQLEFIDESSDEKFESLKPLFVLDKKRGYISLFDNLKKSRNKNSNFFKENYKTGKFLEVYKK